MEINPDEPVVTHSLNGSVTVTVYTPWVKESESTKSGLLVPTTLPFGSFHTKVMLSSDEQHPVTFAWSVIWPPWHTETG